MFALEVALLVLGSGVGSGVGIHIEDARGVSEDDVAVLSMKLKDAIEARSGRAVVVDKTLDASCAAGDRCLDALRTRAESSDIVLLRLLGVPTRVRILAERIEGSTDSPTQKVEVDLPRTRESWTITLESVAASLFPEKKPGGAAVPPRAPSLSEPAGSLVPPRPPAGRADVPAHVNDETHWAPWIAIGAGVVAGSIGAGFGLSSRSARKSAETRPHSDQEIADLEDRALGHGLAANFLFGTAIIGVGTGVVLLLLEE